jgi:steroid delta-isomerase-like uncharacterized protein
MATVEDVIRKTAQALTDHDADAAAKLYARDATVTDPFYPEPLRGEAAIRKDAADFIRAFPDLRFEVTNAISKGETAIAEGRITGTHKGPLTGPQGEIPPTNKRVDLRGAMFVRIGSDGKIVEERRYYDSGTIMRQLGLMEAPAEQMATEAEARR